MLLVIMLLKYEDQRYGFKIIYAMYENVKKKITMDVNNVK